MGNNIPTSWSAREPLPYEMNAELKRISDAQRIITSIRMYTGTYTSEVYNAIQMTYGQNTKKLDGFQFQWGSWVIIIQSIYTGNATWYKVKYNN